MNWQMLATQNQEHLRLEQELRQTTWKHDELTEEKERLGRSYARGLHNVIKKRVQEVVGDTTEIGVWLRPLVNHREETVTPFVTLRYAGRRGRFELEALVNSDADLDGLINRFRKAAMVFEATPTTKAKPS